MRRRGGNGKEKGTEIPREQAQSPYDECNYYIYLNCASKLKILKKTQTLLSSSPFLTQHPSRRTPGSTFLFQNPPNVSLHASTQTQLSQASQIHGLTAFVRVQLK